MKDKIFLAGGAGFIGRNILESFLSSKYEIISPTQKGLDLSDQSAVLNFFKNNNFKAVINAAVAGGYNKNSGVPDVFNNNLRIFFNLAKAENFYSKMIFFGSGASYDKRKSLTKIKESNLGESIPEDDYGFYKYICSKYAENSQKIISINLFGIFGKYEDYKSKFISNAIVKNIFEQDITINKNVIFDYLFIDDLMQILDYFIENQPKFNSYNITPDQSIDLLKITEYINQASDFKSKVIVLNEGMANEYTGNNSRLKEEILHIKFTDTNNAIKNLFNYYKKNRDLLDKEAILRDEYLKSINENPKSA